MGSPRGLRLALPTVTSHLIRHARLVPLAPGEDAPDRAGRRPRRGRRRDRGRPAPGPPGRRRRDRRRGPLADARALGPARAPGAVDARVPAPRPGLRALPRGRDAGGGRAGRGVPRAPRHRLGPPLRRLGPRGHGLRARRGLRRHRGRPDQRRRPPRLAQHDRAHAPRAAGTRLGGPRGRVVRGVRPAQHAGRQRRHLARGLPPHARPRGGDGRRRDRRLRVQRRRLRVGRALGRRRRPAADPDGDVRRHPRGRHRGRPAHRRHAARLRRPDHDGAAQDHLRRLARTPGRRGAASRTPTRTGWSTPPASPTSPATTCACCSPGRTRPGSRWRRTRSATRRSRRRWRRTPRPAPAARSSTPSWSTGTTYDGWRGSACAAASSRRTCSTTAT